MSINIADFIPAGEIIEFDPVYKNYSAFRYIGEANRGYTARVLDNGLVLTEQGDVLGFTTLTSELRGQTANQTYAVATKDWVYDGIRVADLYNEMITDLRQEALA